MTRWLVGGVAAAITMVAALAVGGALNAISRLPALEPWHRLTTTLEARAGDLPDTVHAR
jgi:hypothetical protein